MQEGRIAVIDKHLEALRARRAQLVARHSAEERRNRTRQIIILGSWLIAHRPDLVERITSGLQRPQDRKAFGLPELAQDLQLPTRN
jgi:hypothetical protein